MTTRPRLMMMASSALLGNLGEQVAGEQHCAAVVGKVAQEDPHRRDAVGVESVEGLVEDEDARIADEG